MLVSTYNRRRFQLAHFIKNKKLIDFYENA
jgi:hypothetical protein